VIVNTKGLLKSKAKVLTGFITSQTGVETVGAKSDIRGSAARLLTAEMAAAGVAPDAVTMCAVLAACDRAGDCRAAWDVFESMAATVRARLWGVHLPFQIPVEC
jgi:hypothetical protein